MNNYLTVSILAITTFFSSLAISGDINPFHTDPNIRSLGILATATDIIKFKCGTQVGINKAEVRLRDYTLVSKPVMRVQIAPATSTACGSPYTTAVQDGTTASGDANSGWSTYSASINATSAGNYCLKISKLPGHQNNAALPDQANLADDYQLEHHCYNNTSAATKAAHPSSIYPGVYIQNQ